MTAHRALPDGGSTARPIARLLVAVLLAIAVLPPLLWATSTLLDERRRLEDRVTSLAWHFENSSVAVAQRSDAQRLLARPNFDAPTERRSLLGASGQPLVEVGASPEGVWPALTGSRALQRSGVAGVRLEVQHSLRPLLVTSGAVAFSSSLVALLLWLGVVNGRVRSMHLSERRQRSTAQRDALTGLLNRDGLRLSMQHALQHRRAPRTQVGVMVIDVDRFHLVNNSLGQPVGDALLCSVAQRIRAAVRDTDKVARIGGDQFAVQAEGLSDPQALAVMATNLLRAFESPCRLATQEMTVSLSIGIAIGGDDGAAVDLLLKNAEVAMRAAKAAGGGGWRSFEPHMRVDDDARLALHRRLRRALDNGEYTLLFQPIVEAGSGRISAVEALLRWADPDHAGLVPPDEFIPALEQTGLIVAVGKWVLRDACRHGLGWLAGGNHALVLSVNVSPRQFAEADFVESVMSIVAETGFPAERLQLEVTEGLLLEPTNETLRKIDALVHAGVRLALDDFGMGYSSMAYLKSLPLHTLKVDRMFVRDVVERARDATIVRALVDLGHGLGLHVTAEGVETEPQRDRLQALGVDSLQGYLFARPVSAAEIHRLLAVRGSAGGDDAPPTNWSTTMAAVLHPV